LSAKLNEKAEKVWAEIQGKVLNNIKVFILKNNVNDVLGYYTPKINGLVWRYSRRLPYYVADAEKDDLHTIAHLELLETFKAWLPEKSLEIWPLAQARITGAMKDHIRHISRSDPSRFYEWVTDAAYLFKAINDRADFECRIETGVELTQAMKVLSIRERKVVVHHTKEDLTFKQIGALISVSESQVSRIYKKAIEKIKIELLKEKETTIPKTK
jgi:RNA polymerase sigma factor (sigma-70 family)